MTKEIIGDIVAAEGKAGERIEKAQTGAREAALLSQEALKSKQESEIAAAKERAKKTLFEKREELKNETARLILSNETSYKELLKEAALKIDEAAGFIAERILK
ncbi:hypothetical protein SDC9_172823 [bioreactor metagenome]|uniref:V-type ATP synthase subunit H n=1 Tax=bioreactor metagenome TaxID=1076179 RepID=A0A645GN78_9ZZZZ